MYFSTKKFNCDSKRKVLVAEISDLGIRLPRSPFVRVYHDSADEGLVLMSHKTGKKATFYIDHIETDEGDIRWWTLLPTIETMHDIPQLRGWKIELFND